MTGEVLVSRNIDAQDCMRGSSLLGGSVQTDQTRRVFRGLAAMESWVMFLDIGSRVIPGLEDANEQAMPTGSKVLGRSYTKESDQFDGTIK
jgi:hypothetical protein